MKDYTMQAITKAEKDGILNYNLKGSTMTYTVTYPTEGSYKHIVNLITGKEVITGCKKVFKKYDNRG